MNLLMNENKLDKMSSHDLEEIRMELKDYRKELCDRKDHIEEINKVKLDIMELKQEIDTMELKQEIKK